MNGLCECGCGGLAPIATNTVAARNRIAGQPQRFIHNHDKRRRTYTVDPETGCWIWNHRRNTGGYGQLWDGSQSQVRAHRYFFEQAHGAIPSSMDVHHLCGNRACVNPDHLEAIAHADHTRLHNYKRAA